MNKKRERNSHAGQGTANRSFFFHNAMLELLWVHDPEEAKSPQIHRMGIQKPGFLRNTSLLPQIA